MTDRTAATLGALVLRVSLGAMFIAHSVYLKGVVFTLPGTAAYFGSLGLPSFLAYVVFAMEAVGGLFLVLGVKTRWVALALLPVLAGAAWAHAGNGWLFTNAGGGWEYPVFLAIATLAQALVGDGAYALSASGPFAGRTPASARAEHYAH